MSSSNSNDRRDPVRLRFTPDEQRSLSDAVLTAIEEHEGIDLRTSEFLLYEDINPDALDELFRLDADANVYLTFDTDDVRVKLWGNGEVFVEVSDREERI